MERREFIEPGELRPVVERLVRRWCLPSARFVRNIENAVYEIPTGHRSVFLRITPATHHTAEEVASELAFIRFLSDQGVPVARPVADPAGSFEARVELDGTSFAACVFEEASGVSYEDLREVDHSTFFFEVGRLMAELHEAGTRYQPGSEFFRFSWCDDRWNRFHELIPQSETEAWALFEELERWTATLPTDPRHFGLIHGDFTIANLRIDGTAINLFDLDSCCFHWHACEVAAFLHYFGARRSLRDLAYHRVLEGYAQIRPTQADFLEQIPMFGKMRLLYSFLVFAQEWGFEDLTLEQEAYFDLRRRLFAGGPLWPPDRQAL